jgi:hypothetical protein
MLVEPKPKKRETRFRKPGAVHTVHRDHNLKPKGKSNAEWIDSVQMDRMDGMDQFSTINACAPVRRTQ